MSKVKIKIDGVTAVIEKDKDGYFAYCPELQGCYTSGATYEEAMVNLEDAIRLHVEDRAEEAGSSGATA